MNFALLVLLLLLSLCTHFCTSFDEVEFNADKEEAAPDDEVALFLDDHSCSSLNSSASNPNDKGSVDRKSNYI